jgi:hypothetical protein
MLKDESTARLLIDDIDTAGFSHPTARLASTFASRVTALHKRTRARHDPTLSFPRPSHPMFPEQALANEAIATTLAQERTSAIDLSSKAQQLLDEYQGASEAVRRVEDLLKDAQRLSEELTAVSGSIENGFPDANGDGTPPSLDTPACLDRSRHSAYLALLPSATSQVEALSKKVKELCSTADILIPGLTFEGISMDYKESAISVVRQLAALAQHTSNAHDVALKNVHLLGQVRGIWEDVDREVQALETIRQEVASNIVKDRWRRQSISDAAPPTPESVHEELATEAPFTSLVALQRLDELEHQCRNAIVIPSNSLANSLNPGLQSYMSTTGRQLLQWATDVRTMTHDWDNVRAQSDAMANVKAQVFDLQLRMEDAGMQLAKTFDDVLAGAAVSTASDVNLEELEKTFNGLGDTLHSQVPMISRNACFRPDAHLGAHS